MIHPAWQILLPKLRAALDKQGLSHVVIRERSVGDPMEIEELVDTYDSADVYFDESVCFEPADPKWRIYRVEGAPANDWIGRAHLDDFQQTPTISRSGSGKWEIIYTYDQGCLPADTFENETAFLETLVENLVKHFTDRVYTLGVSIYPDGCSWGRI